MTDVSDFFNAKTFAIVGASRDEKKVGHAIFKNLLSSGKRVIPVNPNAKEILGHKCYADLLDVPYEIDCVVVAVPAKLVPLILRHAQDKKIKSAIITSAGFSENGNNDLEKRILQIADEAGIKILGPNSYGIMDTLSRTNSTYFRKIPKPGHIAFISQSGAIGSAVLDKQEKLSAFVSVGNGSQIDFSDFIEYFSDDKNTKVITLYLESLKEGRGKDFIKSCKKCRKPILVLKAGKSKDGQKTARTHTAALSSEQGVYSGIFKQAGLIEVSSIKQLFLTAKILEKYQNIGNNAMVITNAGGLGVLTSDACAENKIKIKQLSEKTTEELNKVLNPNWSKRNPVDLIGDALSGDYSNALEILEKSEKFDFYIILLTPQIMTQPLETARLLLKLKKPVFTCFLGGEQLKHAKEFLLSEGIINFGEVKEMCDAIGRVIK
ncbi:MAG: CoA-binding protein [Nanoarchaeota archaeon]|nr:CoA-binding protein [Nanoarchaeota archaeon]